MVAQLRGIKRLSPSSLNCWAANPALWAVRYLRGVKSDPSPSMWLGSAVEAGLITYLRTSDEDDANYSAVHNFEMEANGLADDSTEAARLFVWPMLSQAIEAASEWEYDALAFQSRVEIELPGVALPVVGFIDIKFPERIVELKTTKACPSEVRPDHLRQVALYSYATGLPASVLYVTPKKHREIFVTPDEAGAAVAEVTRVAQSLCNFLRLDASTEDLVRCLPVAKGDFRWDDATIAEAEKVFS